MYSTYFNESISYRHFVASALSELNCIRGTVIHFASVPRINSVMDKVNSHSVINCYIVWLT